MPASTTSPIAAAEALVDALRLAGVPSASPRTATAARRAWEAAPALVRAQAALILDAEGTPWRGAAEAAEGTPARLPLALALATLASVTADEWAGADPASAEASAEAIRRRLARLGYPVEELQAADVYAAAWMAGTGNSDDAVASMLERAETLLAAGMADGEGGTAALEMARGLVAAGRRRALLDRNGLILPDEMLRAIDGLSYADVTRETGAPNSAISGWVHGTRRVSDAAAVWAHDRLERAAPAGAVPKRRAGRPKL